MYVAADDDDPGLQRTGVTRQIAGNFLLVFGPGKDRVPNGRIVQHDDDEFDWGTRSAHLPFEPDPLFASGLEGGVGVQ